MIHKYQLVSKILNRLSSEKNRFWRYLPIEKVSSRGLGVIPTANEFRIMVNRMLGCVDRVLMGRVSREECDIIVHEADLAMSHTFDCLGSGPVKMERIDWHTDFKSGYSWPKGVYYKRLRSMQGDGSDIKVPWELSRCHHLLWLAEAYLITNKEKYAQEVVDEIVDWIDENPYMHSVNWTCAMDVSIRAVNWLYAINMIWKSNCMTDEFVSKLYKSLYQHGFYIYHNLEKRVPYSNNHYFSDLVGLLYLGQLFKHTKRGLKWWRFSVSEYYLEIRLQTLPSGANYERSVSYHRLMTELSAYPLYMLKRMGENIPHDILYRVGKMYDYVVNYTKPNGFAPIIGDNDNGRFLPFVKRDFRLHKYLINDNSCENVIISAGINKRIIPCCEKQQPIADYRDAGCVIMRENGLYLYVTNGERGCYLPDSIVRCGVHSHSDLLSFEMALGGDDVFVDTGAYIYTSNVEDHVKFRATHKHNTIVVDDEEQLEPTSSAFVSNKNSVAEFLVMDNKKMCGKYHTIRGKMEHSRTFDPQNNALLIEDVVRKNGDNHQLLLLLHLAPHVQPSISNMGVELITESYNINISFKTSSPYKISIVDDLYSPSYGVVEKTKVVELSLQFNNKAMLKTELKWERKHC